MPGYKAHIIGATAVTAGALFAAHTQSLVSLTPGLTAGLMAASILATLFPDTDTASKARPYFYGLLAATDLALLMLGEYRWAALLGLFAMLPAVGNHRGWTHRWWAALVVPLPLLLAPMFFRYGLTRGVSELGLALAGLIESGFTGGWWSTWQPIAPFYAAAVLGYGVHLVMDRKW